MSSVNVLFRRSVALLYALGSRLGRFQVALRVSETVYRLTNAEIILRTFSNLGWFPYAFHTRFK